MTVNINASTNSKRIPIGRCEDNEATRVVFDCSGFSSAYGSGQATLLHRRSKEKISYIVENVTQEDDTVTWTVSSDDTAFSGEGTLQLMWTVNDVVAHSVFYTTITDPSLTDSSSEPTEVKSALQLLIDSCYTKEETDNLIAHMRVGSDWNAGEGEDGYIENRPFYTESGGFTKIFDGVYNSSSASAPVPVLVDGSPYYYAFIDGENYRVEYGELSYDCTAFRHPVSNMMMIGNGSVIGGEINAEYPFTIFSNSRNNQIMGSFNHAVTLSLSVGDPAIVHKLDSKYLDLNGKLIASGTGENSEIFNDLETNLATGANAHSEGMLTKAYGDESHAEGYNTVSNNTACHAEGYNTRAQAMYSHCEGRSSSLTKKFSYSGVDAPAVAGVFGVGSHCEGEECRIGENAPDAHAEGWRCCIEGVAHNAHAEGYMTSALGRYCHSEGQGTIATGWASHVGGKYNIVDDSNNSYKVYAEIIGNGTSNTNRSNARTLDWSGNESLAGSLTLGMNTNDEITITPAQLAKLLYPFRENHWESPRFIFPSAYVTANSATLYTEEEAMAMSGDVRTIYYFPEEIDLDAISTLDVSVCAVYRSGREIIPMLAHQTLTSFSENLNVLWSSNCKGFLMASFIYITRASDFHSSTGEAYAFPSNVKTIAVLSMSNKPDSSGRLPSFIQSISFDWTPSE